MAGLLKRLIKKTAQTATKKVVKKKPTPKSTTAKRAAVRTKAKTAAKTKVNTNPKVGTRAVLKGKDVYWGGKDWGWQSKASLTKITNGTAKKPPTKPNTTKLPKPKNATPPPKKGDAPKGTRDSANSSKTITARGRSAQKLRERAAAKRTSKSKVNTRLRTEEGSGSKIAVAPGVKKSPGAKKSGTKTTQLTKRQRDRRSLTNKRDIGAKAAAAKTPKSVRKTASQAGGPVNKGRDVKNSTDITAKQRDGKSASYGTAKQPKSTNAPQTKKGRVERNARVDSREAVDSFRAKAAAVIKKRVDNKSGMEASRLRQKLNRQAKKSEKVIKSAAEAASKNSQVGKKNNVSSSASNPTVNSRDWRNRMTDSKVKKMSEQMTQQLSGKKVRGNDELLQSPKGKGQSSQRQERNATGRAKTGTGSYSAKGSGGSTPASTAKGKKKVDPNSPTKINKGEGYGGNTETSVSRPRPNKGSTARKDNSYEPKGIDPSVKATGDSVTKTGNRSSTTGELVKQQGPKRKPAKVDMSIKARTGGNQSAKTQAGMATENKREQKAMQALRERNLEIARKAKKDKESNLRSSRVRRGASTRRRMKIKGQE